MGVSPSAFDEAYSVMCYGVLLLLSFVGFIAFLIPSAIFQAQSPTFTLLWIGTIIFGVLFLMLLCCGCTRRK
jgi:hypothetical protein